MLFEECVCYDSAFSWQNSISLCPASFCIPRPNLPVTNLNKILYNYTVEMRNKFKGLDLIDRVPVELWTMEAHDIV